MSSFDLTYQRVLAPLKYRGHVSPVSVSVKPVLHSTPEVFIIRLQLHIAMPCTHSGIVRDKFGNSASNPCAPLPPPPPATQRVCCLAMISTVTQTRNRSLHAFRSVSTCVCVCAPFSALPVVQMSRYTFINWACVWGCARTRACWFCSERLLCTCVIRLQYATCNQSCTNIITGGVCTARCASN